MDKENLLRPLLTEQFLGTLVEAIKTCGWQVDYTELIDFVKWCFELAEKESPSLEVYK